MKSVPFSRVSFSLSGTGKSPDDLVGWKTIPHLSELLEKRLNRKFSHHAISTLLWRLKKSLQSIGQVGSLVESFPKLGARLRLKRGEAAAAPSAR